jgi:hypothetical protein
VGSYHAVLAVQWDDLEQKVLVPWSLVLKGEWPVRMFGTLLAPHTTLEDFSSEEFDHRWEAWRATRPRYLEHVGWQLNHPLLADGLRCSSPHATFHELALDRDGDDLLAEAIAGTAGAARPGAEGSPYSGSLEGSHLDLAWTKHHFHFLDSCFDLRWDGEWLYDVTPAVWVSPAVTSLFEALLFSIRAFPGTSVTSRGMVWPAGNQRRLPGYLNPTETDRLAQLIPCLREARSAREHEEDFAAFTALLTRSATRRLGLVTLCDDYY